jgi:SAM-dependent methyltransferase
MGKEIDLMINYPRSKRNVEDRGEKKTDKDRELARQFGEAFFDGHRDHGYGGFSYNSRFWEPVVPTFQSHFNLTSQDNVLDVGCAKGFMLYDFQRLIPGIGLAGIDISEYAITRSMEAVKDLVQVGDAADLPFDDNSFDVSISVTTIHNLELDLCGKALQELERVSRRGSFVTLDAYRNDDEKARMESWNLTAKTMMHVDEWKKFFKEVGYTGDYYWFIP